jgi:signal transduction histidine kinase
MDASNGDRICVQVFAKISAAISHEIKNSLSIINENAGLLDDFAEMAEQTGGLPRERIQPITGKIMQQVNRSNTIMKNINRFAHSSDTRPAHGNLQDTLSLMAELTNREAAMKEITVTVDCPPGLTLYTDLISFESLIFLTLCTLFESSAAGSSFSIHAVEEQAALTICFIPGEKTRLTVDIYPDQDQQVLAEQLAGSCQLDQDQLCITVPARVA